MTIFFISDLHFFHEKIIQLENRPFENLDHMHTVMIERWNSVVTRRDTVYCPGDFTGVQLGTSRQKDVDKVLRALNGQKHLIIGNHDGNATKRSTLWNWVDSAREIKVNIGLPDRQKIYLHHYAGRVWPSQGRGAWMIHGHSHGNLRDIGGKTLDVGAPVHNYTPVSLEWVIAYMRERPIYVGDHHVQTGLDEEVLDRDIDSHAQGQELD